MSDGFEWIREAINERSPLSAGEANQLLDAYDAKCQECDALREALEAQGHWLNFFADDVPSIWHLHCCLRPSTGVDCSQDCQQARRALGYEVVGNE